MQKLQTILTITILFCYTLSARAAETAIFDNITEAYHWADTALPSHVEAVQKLIITGKIQGDDYSQDSEWSMFLQLNNPFPNIEEVEILTDQDIPDGTARRGFFFSSDIYNPSHGLAN